MVGGTAELSTGVGGLLAAGRFLRRIAGAALASLILANAADAQTKPPLTAPSPAFRAFVESLWPEAREKRVSRETFDRAFRGVEPDLSLPDLILSGRTETSSRGQAEFTRPPQDYLARAQLARLAEQGRSLQTRHAETLARIEAKLGVERAVVLAIWGRETAFGGHKLQHYAIRVLATQAFTGRRKELFRNELIFALRMLEDRLATVETMRSSWAGAMGLTQFMPSEFYSSAYDLDGNGRVDLFTSVPDALASAANQLKLKGWITGVPWGFEVRTGADVDCANEGPLNARPMADWVRRGVARADGRAFPPAVLAQPAYLMSPGGIFGPQFLVTDNFKVLRAYNTSDLYAVFVGHLSDRIAGGGDFRTPWAEIRQLPTREIEEIQRQLQTRGYAVDKIDGKIGSNTRWQIGLYERSQKLQVGCWPTESVLKSLRGAPAR